MKNHTIKTDKVELMIAELAEGLNQMRKNTLSVMQHDGWELIGKIDEIKEEDAKELVGNKGNYYKNYSPIHGSVQGNITFTAKESLLSLLESEVYWENPHGEEPLKYTPDKGSSYIPLHTIWQEAESRTFDKSRTLIFVKN